MKISSCSKTYDGITVLNAPQMELSPGRIYSIIGSNGSGKSTYARILANTLSADQKASPLPPDVSVGYLPQKNYAFRMSVRANIMLGCSDKERAEHLMEALHITHLADSRADRLSGGETARMAMARLMMKHFNLVILDEPTATLDVETTFLAENLIQDYVRESNCVLLLITHSLQQARRIADKILFFHKGQLWESGTPEQLLHAPSRPETKLFLDFYGIQ